MITHVALESDGKISGKKWKADHTVTMMIAPSRTLFFDVDSLAAYNPPAAWGAGSPNLSDKTKTQIPFNYIQPNYARLMSMWDRNTGIGAPVNPSMRLRCASGTICEIVDGTHTGVKKLFVGSWNDVSSFRTDIEVYIQTQDSKADARWDVYSIGVEFR